MTHLNLSQIAGQKTIAVKLKQLYTQLYVFCIARCLHMPVAASIQLRAKGNCQVLYVSATSLEHSLVLQDTLLHAVLTSTCAADGYPVDSMNQHEVNEQQRGPLGSTTVLTILPKDQPQVLKTVYLERRPLPQPPLKQVNNSRCWTRRLPVVFACM